MIVIYTHSSYHDCLDLTTARLDKFGEKYIIISNQKYKDKETIIYNDLLSYSERLIEALEQISESVILYCHEDHLLYSEPDWEIIKDLRFSVERRRIDFVKLCYTGDLILGNEIGYNQFELLMSKDIFAVQPTIWNRDSLISFLKKAGPRTIWGLEEIGSEFIGDIRGSIYLDGTEKRVGAHRNSNVFPCILTALVKGKWNMSEYGTELTEIFKKSKLDFKIRGAI